MPPAEALMVGKQMSVGVEGFGDGAWSIRARIAFEFTPAAIWAEAEKCLKSWKPVTLGVPVVLTAARHAPPNRPRITKLRRRNSTRFSVAPSASPWRSPMPTARITASRWPGFIASVGACILGRGSINTRSLTK